jgi:alpha-beta hydrolase superfamily lysophospholipase
VRTRRRPLLAALALAALVVASAASCAEEATTAVNAAAPARQSVPALAPPPGDGRPGEVLAAYETAPPSGARAWIVDFRSQGARALTGQRAMLVVPMKEPPPDGFPLVVWGHPTKGSADACAPSAQGPATIPLIDAFVQDGYAVVAPDYEGLAAEGPHPYLVGASEGRSMLDAARAATQVKGSGVRAGSPVVLWGFSQGGHAAAFAGELAATHAPDVAVKGVAVAAPVTDVDHFVARSQDWPEQFGVLVATVVGFGHAYDDIDPGAVLSPTALAETDVLEQQCISEVNQLFNRPIAEQRVARPRDVPALARRLDENRAGQQPLRAPALVVQGERDSIVDPADTATLVRDWCASGVPVSYLVRPGQDHGVLSDDVLLPWMRGRLVGDTPPSTCAPGATVPATSAN